MKNKIWLVPVIIIFFYSGSITYTSEELHKVSFLDPLPQIPDPVPVLTVSAAIDFSEEIKKEETKETVIPLELKQICACESAGSKLRDPIQFKKDGSVLRGIQNPADVGACQINVEYHGESAKKLGFNIYSLEGNLAYANLLYMKEGSKPWNASKACWH